MNLEKVAVLALVALAMVLRFANLGNVASRTADESVYTNQAALFLQNGDAALRELTADYLKNAPARKFPPPTRVGMIRLVAAAMKWKDSHDEGVGAFVSCAASLGSVFVLAMLGLRFFPPMVLLVALLFSAVSPMQLAISRRTWADASIEFIALSMIYIVCEVCYGSRRRIWYLPFAALAAIGITIKESTAVPCGICSLWIVWTLIYTRREWKDALIFVAVTAPSVGAAAWWLAHLVGGFPALVQVVTGIPAANAVNPYALQYASGPGYELLFGYWFLTPMPALLSLVGLYVAFRETTPQFRWIAVFALIHVLFAMLIPHWLNLRYTAVAYGCFYLLAGLGFRQLYLWCSEWFRILDRRLIAALAVAVLATGAWGDYQRFQQIFVRDGLADLSIGLLLNVKPPAM